jgi:hypothetical protein
VPLVELINLRLAIFTAKTKLVAAQRPGERLIEMAGNVVAAFRRRLADDFKSADVDVGRLRIRGIGDEAE